MSLQTILIPDPDDQVLGCEDEAGHEMKYADVFALPTNATGSSRKRKRVEFDEPPIQDDDARTAQFQKDLFAAADASVETERLNVSTHAKRRAAIKAQVEQLEKENIGCVAEVEE
jgi:U3 small nucleolar ribonucleoprotein component